MQSLSYATRPCITLYTSSLSIWDMRFMRSNSSSDSSTASFSPLTLNLAVSWLNAMNVPTTRQNAAIPSSTKTYTWKNSLLSSLRSPKYMPALPMSISIRHNTPSKKLFTNDLNGHTFI